MIKSILVPATGSASDLPGFAAALAVARGFAAHIDFLHVRIDAAAMAAVMATDGAGAAVSDMIDRFEQESDERERQARQSVEDFCRSAGLAVADTPAGGPAPSAQWHRETGDEPDWIVDYGRAADLLVVGRPADKDGVSNAGIEAALLHTGRPLLIPPPAGIAALPETIAIAWKSTAEAARAVAAAMPFLAMAKSVAILTVEEDAQTPAATRGRLAANLARHGFSVSQERLRPGAADPAEVLIAAAAERAGLLVMGGYGHSRLREWMFGGFTARVLAGVPLPVLMAH